MKNKYKLKNFMLVLMLLCSPCNFCRGASTLNQSIITNVPPAVLVDAGSALQTTGTINPDTGNNSGVTSDFSLKTNGTDANYDYIVTSSAATTGGIPVSAYAYLSSQLYLIFANNTIMPTIAAINDIKTSPVQGNNPNAIAYPVNMILSGLQSATYTSSGTYGECLVVKTGSSQQGNIKQTITGAPLTNTYYFAEDKPGTYTSTLTFTANRKP